MSLEESHVSCAERMLLDEEGVIVSLHQLILELCGIGDDTDVQHKAIRIRRGKRLPPPWKCFGQELSIPRIIN